MADSKEKVEKPEADWREKLTPEQYQVTRQAGTERPFQNEYWDCKQEGAYHCICCGAKLFDSDSKYDSGTGWPSFDRPVDADAVSNRSDTSHGMARTEVVCSRCDAHLGHVFPDGPPTTGERYCMNSASLRLEAKDED